MVVYIFTEQTFEALKKFAVARYGIKKALSITVEEAVRNYLEEQNGKS